MEWAIANAHKSHLTVLYPYRLTKSPIWRKCYRDEEKIENEALKNFGVLEKDLLLDENISYDFKSEVGFLANRVEEHTRNHPVSFMVIDKKY